MNVDKIVPSADVMKARAAEAQQQQAAQQAMLATNAQQGNPMQGGTPEGAPGGAQLMDGAPVTNRFQQ
jgi:hypothetical protein